MRIAIVGTGSLGTVVGAMLTRAGLDVSMVDANQEHVAALNQKGSKIVKLPRPFDFFRLPTSHLVNDRFGLWVFQRDSRDGKLL